MSILDPEVPLPNEPEPFVLPPTAKPARSTAKDVCAKCLRPAIDWGDGTVSHMDASIDAHNGGPCEAELYVEPQLRWGFLNDPKR